MPSVGSLEREQIRAVAEKLNSVLRERANLFVERPRTKKSGAFFDGYFKTHHQQRRIVLNCPLTSSLIRRQ